MKPALRVSLLQALVDDVGGVLPSAPERVPREVQSTRRVARIIGGCVGLLGGMVGLTFEILNIGVIDGVVGAMATLGVLDFGPTVVPSSVASASLAATGGLLCSALIMVFAVAAIFMMNRWPSALLIAAAITGCAIGGGIAAPGMLIAMLGGVLALVGAAGPASPSLGE